MSYLKVEAVRISNELLEGGEGYCKSSLFEGSKPLLLRRCACASSKLAAFTTAALIIQPNKLWYASCSYCCLKRGYGSRGRGARCNLHVARAAAAVMMALGASLVLCLLGSLVLMALRSGSAQCWNQTAFGLCCLVVVVVG
jgi:hypothetical protein